MLNDARNFDREQSIVAMMVGARAALTFSKFGFKIHLTPPGGGICIVIGTQPTITVAGVGASVTLNGNPPFSPLIEALDGKTISAARLSSELLELEFGPTLLQVPHTPDLCSFVIGVNFGEGDPLSGTWFF